MNVVIDVAGSIDALKSVRSGEPAFCASSENPNTILPTTSNTAFAVSSSMLKSSFVSASARSRLWNTMNCSVIIPSMGFTCEGVKAEPTIRWLYFHRSPFEAAILSGPVNGRRNCSMVGCFGYGMTVKTCIAASGSVMTICD